MLRDIPLSYLVSILVTGIILSVSTMYAGSVSSAVSELSIDLAGQSLDVTAERVEESVQQSIRERLRDLDQAIVAAAKQGVPVRQSFSHLIRHDASATEVFQWVGELDADGKIRAEAGSAMPSSESEYWAGLVAAGTSDVRPYAAVNSVKTGNSPRLMIDLLVPVMEEGRINAFVGARVDASFVHAVAATLPGYGEFSAPPNLIVVDHNFRPVLVPANVRDVPGAVTKALQARVAAKPFILSSWENGAIYITGFARSSGQAGVRSPSWSILVRQPAAAQLAPLESLQNRIWLYATFFVLHGILVAWIISSLVCGPFLRLARAADAIRDGKSDAAMPVESSCREAQLLSKSLVSLVGTLKEKERSQAALATSLEDQVKQRTLQLSDSNEQLKLANQRAQETITSRTRFLACASHDLRQPLQSLVLVTRQLVRRFNSGEDGRLMGRMEQSITSLSRMFNQLLDLSRLDTGIVQARMTRISVASLLERIAGEARSEASARGLDFRYVRGECLVSCDPVILETIIRNLLSNAMKFTRRGGVLLGVRRAGQHVDICVYDTGPGIRAEEIPELFSEFYRSPMQGDTPNPGLGLGLSIVRRYADIIGADVLVRSNVGKGTCFAIRLQRIAGMAASACAQGQVDEAAFWKKRRVIVVEDDACVRTAIEAELAEACASVTAFRSARAASCAIQQGLNFDVVIADYDLDEDDESGLVFIDRLRKTQRAPFSPLILTGRTDVPTIDEIEAAGTPWLAKPATTHDIAALLQGAKRAEHAA